MSLHAIHHIPRTTVVRERERTLGGHADPNSPESLSIARTVAARLHNGRFFNNRWVKTREPVPPDEIDRTTPYGQPHRPRENAL